MIAALYVDERGPYPRLAGENVMRLDTAIDVWALPRDARLYAGPYAVVAHPPCGPWGRLRHLYRGSEHDCAPRAVEQVRAFGGVLEHPAGSRLWAHCGIRKPPELHEGDRDYWGGYTIEIDQVEWGHVARKRTWLYLVGVPRDALKAPPYPGREPTHWASGSRGASSRTGKPVPPGVKVCSATQRRRTPPELAAYLVRLARAVQK